MRIINLNKSYKDGKNNKQILKNINISFNKSGLVFITGRSGSGKTTLLNIIAGFDKADSGEIIDNEINLLDLPENQLTNYRKYNVGFIAQDYHLIDDFTVLENILLGDNTIDTESNEFKSVIEQLGLQEHLKKKSINLSGGEKQRVAIARVLLKGSSIILADEPTGNLDDENSEIVFNYLKEISKDHLVIVVTHDTSSAKKYADRIIELKSGEISSDSRKVEKDENLDFKFEGKEKFTTKKLFKYSLSFLFLKKIFLIICVLLCSISFGEVFTMLTFQNTNQNELAYRAIANDDSGNFVINKRYVKEFSGYSANYNIPIKDDEIKELESRFNLEDYEIINYYSYDFARNNYDYAFLHNSITRTKIINNNNFLDKYNWKMEYGHMPVRENEFLLTDYALFSMWQLNPKVIDNILGVEYSTLEKNEDFINALHNIEEEKKELIFGQNFDEVIKDDTVIEKLRKNPGLLIVGDWFITDFATTDEKENSENWPKLVGCISTNCIDEYNDLLFTQMKDFDRTNKRMFELGSLVDYSLFSFYATRGFYNYLLKNQGYDSNSNAKIISADTFNKFGYELQINDGELIMSEGLYKRIFKTTFNRSSTTFHKIEWIANYDSLIEENIVYSKEFKVKDVISLTGLLGSMLGDIDFIIINSSEFKKYIDIMNSRCNWGICVNKKELSKIDINSDIFTKRKFTLYTTSASSIYIVFSGAEKSTHLTFILSIVALSIGYTLVTLFFVLIISKRKRDIGIMKALGYSSKQFNWLLGFCGLMFLGLLIISSSILSIILFSHFNNWLITHIANLGLAVDSKLFLLTPNYPIFFIIMGVTLLVLALTVVVANLINKRITPISAIKSL